MLSLSRPGYTPANIAGMIAKYFATSLAIEKVVSAPRVMSSCLPISTISMSLVGLESRSTMLPASLAADVPVFIATPTSAWASAGASLVPSPVIATRWPPSCSLPDQRHLVLGRGLGEEVVDAGLVGDRLGGQRVVAGDHHGADAHPAQLVEALAHALLDDVLEVDDARGRARPSPSTCSATTSGVPPLVEMRVDDGADLGGRVTAVLAHPGHDGRGRALADLAATVEVDAAHPGLGGERHELGAGELARRALAQAVLAAWPARRSSGPPGSRRRGWRAARRPRARLGSHAGDRDELGGLAVAEGDRAGLVEQQRVDVAGGLDRAARHRQHVALHEPVHAGDADGREQRADRGRDQADQQRDEDDDRTARRPA